MARGNAAREDDARHQSRERAMSLLYEAAMKKQSLEAVLDGLAVKPDVLALSLVEGVAGNERRIDELISAAAVGWEIDRMPAVDRSVLRLATYELLSRLDLPVAVVIDEAVELAKRFSTEQSGGFVNGVLATIAREVRA